MYYSGLILLYIFLALVTLGFGFLERFLAKQDKAWLGWILPAISFGFSIYVVFQITNWAFWGRHNTETTAVYQFLLLNIPTVVFIAIYAAVKERKKYLC